MSVGGEGGLWSPCDGGVLDDGGHPSPRHSPASHDSLPDVGITWRQGRGSQLLEGRCNPKSGV